MNNKDEIAKEFLENKEKESGMFQENVSLGNVQKIDNLDLPEPGVTMGWKRLPTENLPSQGLFYPQGSTIEIKAATASEIRHFSTIDEEDLFDMNDKLNMIIDKCVKMKFPGETGISFRDLKEVDRFYIIFCVRELTFIEGENKLYLDIQDPQTGEMEKVELMKEKFSYNAIDERIMGYYSISERSFVFKTRTCGDIQLWIPSIGISNFMFNYLKEKNQKNEFYDKAFLKVAPFLIPNWRKLNNDSYKKYEKESLA